MPYYCTVPRCTSMAGKVKNVSFHQFPRDEELAKLWNQVLKRGKPYTKYSKVCSLHFKPEDYTMTSAQKNRGQWRTLRKDAVPSQNLPSESPADEWHRRNNNSFQSTENIDSSVQHQMAQAIYVQTMLAMQVAGIGDAGINTFNIDQPSPSHSDITHNDDNDTTPIATHTDGKISNTSEKVTFECNQCSKCFKDPDVFILHQRNHVKTEGNTEMLRANPILANLLKNDTENVNKNVISIENQIMSALTENMANYLRNLSTIMTNGNTSNYATDKSDSADDFEGIDNSHDEEYRNVKMEEGDSDCSSKFGMNSLGELDRYDDDKFDREGNAGVIHNKSIIRNDIINTSIKNNTINVICGLNGAEISHGSKEEHCDAIDCDNIIKETLIKTIVKENIGNNSKDGRNVKSCYSDRKQEEQNVDDIDNGNGSNSSIDYRSMEYFKEQSVHHRQDSVNSIIDSRNDDTQTVI